MSSFVTFASNHQGNWDIYRKSATGAGEIVPVPYDFDFAGVIDAKYAVPSEKLDIRSVRQRLFRGFCRPEEVVRGAIDIVEDRRSAINELYRKTAELDAALVERSLAYYDKFFEIVGSPEALRREFLEPCRGDHGAGGAATRGMIAPPHDTPVVLTPGASRVNSQRRIGCA